MKTKTKKVFAKNRSVFSPKLGEDQKKGSSPTVEVFLLLNHFSRGLWCYIRPELVSLFPLVNERSNLDGRTPKSRWGDANSRWGDASPLQCKYCLHWFSIHQKVTFFLLLLGIFSLPSNHQKYVAALCKLRHNRSY